MGVNAHWSTRAVASLTFESAVQDDAAGVAAIRVAAADDLTAKFGRGHWSHGGTIDSVRYDMRTSTIYVARLDDRIVATLRLATRKPWAIDKAHFTHCEHPLYLTTMAVLPGLQRRGIGRFCIEEAIRAARAWPADAIRLDAYAASAGAGEFYAKCGFREVARVTYRGTDLIYFERLLNNTTRLP
jgi:GNAT superfamily N-acetyltransferase